VSLLHVHMLLPANVHLLNNKEKNKKKLSIKLHQTSK